MTGAESPLARLIGFLALIGPALVVYGSLFPLSGWTLSGVPPLAFLGAPFPRYWTVLDLAANFALYVPLGALWAWWLLDHPRLRDFWWIATLPLIAISFGVEVTQNWLPTRVASNVDLACNTLGALIGAALARLCGRAAVGRLNAWCTRNLDLGASGDIAVLLLLLWFVGQWVPDGTAFVLGDWRGLGRVGWPEWVPRPGEAATPRLEAVAVAGFLLGVGLMARDILVGGGLHGFGMICLLLVAAATARALAAAVMVRASAAFDWLTTGAQFGLLAGVALLLPALLLRARWRRWLAVVALLAGTVAINLAAPDPYGLHPIPPAAGGAFANFAGLTELVAACWPPAALAWWLGRRTLNQRA